MTFAISTALAVAGIAGCSGDGDKSAAGGERELFMQPVAAQGPDPFTDSTAKSAATPPPVTRSPQPSPTGSATPQGTRSISGGTPGLYGGTHAVGSCDVGQQIRFLTGDRAKARAFAEASGIEASAIPGFLRGLTPVVLRADTRVTNHGFRDGSATSFQSVLQSGTAVLVDERGLPRVRCACGNPLKPPVAFQGTPRHNGQPWSGYQPTRVVVVTPAPQPITNITIVNIVNNTWIERKIGDEDANEDRRAKPPVPPSPKPTDSDGDQDRNTPDGSVTPSDPDATGPTDPDSSSTACPTPSPVTGTPTEPASPLPPGCPTPTTTPSTEVPSPPEDSTDVSPQEPEDQPFDQSPEDIGPETVPDTPDQSDDGLVPDDPYLSENPLDDSDPGTFAS
ncbi:DUF6777 domain-containing protein [Streptomyces sp. NPDC087300]|uniref:DUF6777 domain-containing protein n=1 Tax=Streptomyces sp. NPDC087300 TaxID=3365780 RepID=UPI0037F81BE1